MGIHWISSIDDIRQLNCFCMDIKGGSDKYLKNYIGHILINVFQI